MNAVADRSRKAGCDVASERLTEQVQGHDQMCAVMIVNDNACQIVVTTLLKSTCPHIETALLQALEEACLRIESGIRLNAPACRTRACKTRSLPHATVAIDAVYEDQFVELFGRLRWLINEVCCVVRCDSCSQQFLWSVSITVFRDDSRRHRDTPYPGSAE
jgi:hypothetical protein